MQVLYTQDTYWTELSTEPASYGTQSIGSKLYLKFLT